MEGLGERIKGSLLALITAATVACGGILYNGVQTIVIQGEMIRQQGVRQGEIYQAINEVREEVRAMMPRELAMVKHDEQDRRLDVLERRLETVELALALKVKRENTQ